MFRVDDHSLELAPGQVDTSTAALPGSPGVCAPTISSHSLRRSALVGSRGCAARASPNCGKSRNIPAMASQEERRRSLVKRLQ